MGSCADRKLFLFRINLINKWVTHTAISQNNFFFFFIPLQLFAFHFPYLNFNQLLISIVTELRITINTKRQITSFFSYPYFNCNTTRTTYTITLCVCSKKIKNKEISDYFILFNFIWVFIFYFSLIALPRVFYFLVHIEWLMLWSKNTINRYLYKDYLGIRITIYKIKQADWL